MAGAGDVQRRIGRTETALRDDLSETLPVLGWGLGWASMAVFRRPVSRTVPVMGALLAVVLVAAGVHQLAVAAGRDTDDTYTIDVNETGFTPDSCKLNRNDSVRFRNAGTTLRRVVIPDVFPNQPAEFDTGMLKPGEVSYSYSFFAPGHKDFLDAADSSHIFTVNIPVLVEKWDEVCLGNPLPPTPTAVGTVPATKSATATTTVTPQPGTRCRGYMACVVTMAVGVGPVAGRPAAGSTRSATLSPDAAHPRIEGRTLVWFECQRAVRGGFGGGRMDGWLSNRYRRRRDGRSGRWAAYTY